MFIFHKVKLGALRRFDIISLIEQRLQASVVVGYRKTPKILNTRKNCCNNPKIGTVSFHYRVIGPKDAGGLANRVNSVDPGQTGHTLLSKTCLSENLGSLWYFCQNQL